MASPSLAAHSPARQRRSSKRPRSERRLRNLVVGAILAAIIVFTLVPIGMAIVGSFYHWNPLTGDFRPAGLENYTRLFADPLFYSSLTNTVVFGVLAIGGRVLLGLALAYALFAPATRAKNFFRAVFFMPTITPLVAVAYVWRLMYHPQFGAINEVLGTDSNWLKDPRYALGAIIVMTLWKDFGYAVILLLAGLYAIDEGVLEAAAVDGATGWQRFRYVILPLLKPMLVFVVITSIIAYLQAFIQIMVLTEGGPGTSTQTLSFMIYSEAFENYQFGYASALALILLCLTALLTTLSWRLQRDGDIVARPGRWWRGAQ
ncbi:sugar ABC transporter permease [Buchananella hordeovulneris]|uniref:carbohydrate ABC transporter permease n=1 Tax=Buchananella hordeovulneris TaxID=52770 RepID=UPI000F5E347C|nr:sugar ABC transporter permease [Buchananella hordeovulneris]RRD53802.1 sugar ABC transporter permease [Buchananella hordeovulneris]